MPDNTLRQRLGDRIAEPTFQDVIDAGQFPTPEEYQKMVWMLRWCKSNVNNDTLANIEADLKGLATTRPPKYVRLDSDCLKGYMIAEEQILAAIERYCRNE
jgi:hypothetical protein